MKIGILGAGLIDGALAKLAADRGHDVMISSRHPDGLASLAARIGCKAGTLEQAAGFGELCMLAVPPMALDGLPATDLAGKVIIDAMNYYPDRDGAIAVLDQRAITTSELVASRLPDARLVKAFNAVLARDLPDDARVPVPSGGPPGVAHRRKRPRGKPRRGRAARCVRIRGPGHRVHHRKLTVRAGETGLLHSARPGWTAAGARRGDPRRGAAARLMAALMPHDRENRSMFYEPTTLARPPPAVGDVADGVLGRPNSWRVGRCRAAGDGDAPETGKGPERPSQHIIRTAASGGCGDTAQGCDGACERLHRIVGNHVQAEPGAPFRTRHPKLVSLLSAAAA